MSETTIGGYEVLGELGDSKRFRAFRASRRAPEGEKRGTLYLMTDEVRHPDLFIETVDTIRAAWPFEVESDRDYVLPKAQLWTGRPWFFVPERLPTASSGRLAGRAAFASLRAQLKWLEQFHPPGGEPSFAHGDVRKERIALFDEEHPLLIAPGWVAASELARGKGLSHVRGDDAWHLGKLWILESDHTFVPDGMEAEADEAARRLPRARLPQREVAAAPKREAPVREAPKMGSGAREAAFLREPSATPAPGRAAIRRDGSGVTASPAARAARPVRETPAPREARPVRETPAPREPRPVRETPAPREAFPQASPWREATAAREASPLRDAGREASPREPVFGVASNTPARTSAVPAARAPAAAAPAAQRISATPPVPQVALVRTPAGPPVMSAPPAAPTLPPHREPPAPAMARPRPAPPQASPVASPLPFDTASSPPDYLRGVPPADVRPPPAPEPPPRQPEPVHVVPAFAEPPPVANDRMASLPAPPSLAPSRPPLAAAPAPKKRGALVAVIVVLLLLAVVFVVALTMLKR